MQCCVVADESDEEVMVSKVVKKTKKTTVVSSTEGYMLVLVIVLIFFIIIIHIIMNVMMVAAVSYWVSLQPWFVYRGGATVSGCRTCDLRSRHHGFESRSECGCVTTLGNLSSLSPVTKRYNSVDGNAQWLGRKQFIGCRTCHAIHISMSWN